MLINEAINNESSCNGFLNTAIRDESSYFINEAINNGLSYLINEAISNGLSSNECINAAINDEAS